MKRYCIAMLTALLSISVCAAKDKKLRTKTVCETYYELIPTTLSIEEGKAQVLEAAQTHAVGTEFGYYITDYVSMVDTSTPEESRTDYYSSGTSYVRGEWIKTIGKPEYKIEPFDDNNIMITVTVKGVIRELPDDWTQIKYEVLCNGTTPQHARTSFVNGDQIYLSFSTPIDGYLAVYLTDQLTGMAYNLLPYRTSSEKSVEVKCDTQYLFFSPNTDVNADELVMRCARGSERNDLYIIFSETPFTKSSGIVNDSDGLRELPLNEFHNWLAKLRTKHPHLQVETLSLLTKAR